MDAPLKPTVQNKQDIAALERGSKKFGSREKEDPFALAEEMNPNNGKVSKGSMLLDKFDLARIDLLDEMNQNNAQQFK